MQMQFRPAPRKYTKTASPDLQFSYHTSSTPIIKTSHMIKYSLFCYRPKCTCNSIFVGMYTIDSQEIQVGIGAILRVRLRW